MINSLNNKLGYLLLLFSKISTVGFLNATLNHNIRFLIQWHFEDNIQTSDFALFLIYPRSVCMSDYLEEGRSFDPRGKRVDSSVTGHNV